MFKNSRCTPISRIYPLGMPMSLARRTALLAWAKQQNAWIIEDDYDSELRYNRACLESLIPVST
jgi:GntR family transcriptional regulator/MocR family aminotransferase